MPSLIYFDRIGIGINSGKIIIFFISFKAAYGGPIQIAKIGEIAKEGIFLYKISMPLQIHSSVRMVECL